MTFKNSKETVHHTLAKYLLDDVYPFVIDLEKSHGNWLVDGKTGKEYLDCFGFISSNPVGHNHPKMFEPSFEKKLLTVARQKPSNSDFWSIPMADFVSEFEDVGILPDFKYLFMVEGGAVAAENALKVAFDWKVRLNHQRGEKGEFGSKMIHFKQAFHGRCGYTLSMTNPHDTRKTKFFPKFDWPRITNPKLYFPNTAGNLACTSEAEEIAYKQIYNAINHYGRDIAGIIIEPIQGEGGDNHFRKEFLQQLRKIADENDLLLIFDEIQTGGGMTGKMWAYQNYGVIPDILIFGKKLQICGILVNGRIDNVENHCFKESSRINSTWGGGLVDMVRAERYLQIMKEENLIDNAAEVGSYLITRLNQISEDFPEHLNNPRGKGLFAAIDCKNVGLRDELKQGLLDQGVLVLKCGEAALRLRPALNFSKSEVDLLIDTLKKVVELKIA